MVDLIIETPYGTEHDYIPGPDVVIYIRPRGSVKIRYLDPSFSIERAGELIFRELRR